MKRRMMLGLILALGAGCAAPGATERKDLVRIDRQLGELYKPLLALVEESRLSVQAFLKEEGRDQILPSDRDLTEAELKRWLKKAEGDLMPRNERMCALIRSKRELVDGPDLPANWKALLEHQDLWREDHEKWRKDGVPYPFHSRTSFPRPLERELRADIQKLEARRAELAGPSK